MSARVLKKPRTGSFFRAAVISVITVAAAGCYSVTGLLSSTTAVIPAANAEVSETLLKISLPAASESRPEKPALSDVLQLIFPTKEEQPGEVPELVVNVPNIPISNNPAIESGRVEKPEPSQVADNDVAAEPPADSKDVQAVTLSPSSDSGYTKSNNIFINNQTKLEVDIGGLMNRKLPLKLTKGKPQILIIHTHGSESFLPDEQDYYVPTDIERTEDTRFNVVRLGDELTGILEQKGLNVIHDRTIYDYPTYSGSYTRTLESITKIVKANPSIQIVIDLHRDSIITSNGTLYKTMSEVQDENTAQMMFVIGSNASGLTHPGYKDNLAMAVQLQDKLNTEYPSIMRPINLRKERFNQHATPGSVILEVGTSGNTLEEAIAAVKRFGSTAGDFWLGMSE